MHRTRPHGQAMVEYVIVLPLLLLLLLGVIQYGMVYRAKVTLNYAAFETARAGSLNNARMLPMENAFARAMGPLFTNRFRSLKDDGTCSGTYKLGDAPAGNFTPEHVRCGREIVKEQLTSQLGRILLVNPSASSFSDHGFDDAAANRRIPSDNLIYRSAAPGSTSQQSVQDANLLKVHLSYCYELLVPFVNRAMSQIMTQPASAAQPANIGPFPGGSFAENCAKAPAATAKANADTRYGIPIYAQAVMRMQSDPIQEPVSCSGFCPAP